MKTTLSAPLEIASNPKAPVPAYISRHTFCSRSFKSQLNKVSFVLLSVGLSALLGLKLSLVPLKLPAIIFVEACLLAI